jgi:hypothetical protein
MTVQVETSRPDHWETSSFDGNMYISCGNLEEMDVRSKVGEKFSILLLLTAMSRKEWLPQTAYRIRHWNHLEASTLLCGIRE